MYIYEENNLSTIKDNFRLQIWFKTIKVTRALALSMIK